MFAAIVFSTSIRRVLDMKTAVTIVQAVVISRLDYYNSLLCGLLYIPSIEVAEGVKCSS